MDQKSNTSNRYSESDRLHYAPYYDLFVDSPFFRPRFKIEFNHRERNTFSPELTLRSYSKFSQRFLRVRVRNTGRKTAHKCEAELTVVIPNGADENELMRHPSDEPKLLVWGRYPQAEELKTSMDIPAKAGRLLHVVFSDSDFALQPNVKSPIRYASVSTLERVRPFEREAHIAENLVIPDSFTNGRFIVEVAITSEEGAYTKAKFQIDVDSDWKKLKMERITQTVRLTHSISWIYNRLIHRQVSKPEPNH